MIKNGITKELLQKMIREELPQLDDSVDPEKVEIVTPILPAFWIDFKKLKDDTEKISDIVTESEFKQVLVTADKSTLPPSFIDLPTLEEYEDLSDTIGEDGAFQHVQSLFEEAEENDKKRSLYKFQFSENPFRFSCVSQEPWLGSHYDSMQRTCLCHGPHYYQMLYCYNSNYLILDAVWQTGVHQTVHIGRTMPEISHGSGSIVNEEEFLDLLRQLKNEKEV